MGLAAPFTSVKCTVDFNNAIFVNGWLRQNSIKILTIILNSVFFILWACRFVCFFVDRTTIENYITRTLSIVMISRAVISSYYLLLKSFKNYRLIWGID